MELEKRGVWIIYEFSPLKRFPVKVSLRSYPHVWVCMCVCAQGHLIHATFICQGEAVGDPNVLDVLRRVHDQILSQTPNQTHFFYVLLVALWWLGSLAQLLKKATCFEPIGQGQFSCLTMWVLLFCLFIYFYPTITYPFLTGPLATWAGPVCALPASLPPRSFPGSDHLGSLCPCLESLDCSSSETREIRSWRTFDRKAVLCFLLMLLPLPLFPTRDVNTCIFLF